MFVIPEINPETGQVFLIRQPERRYVVLPAEGADVPNNRFYRAHLKDGSLRLGEVLNAAVEHVMMQVESTGEAAP